MLIRNRMEAETDYQFMVTRNSFDSMVLYQSIQKNFNESTSVISEGAMENIVEVLHNFILIKCDEFTQLSNNIDSSDKYSDMLKQCDFKVASACIRYSFMSELVSRRQDHTVLCRTLDQQK